MFTRFVAMALLIVCVCLPAAYGYVPLSDEQLFEYTELMQAVEQGDAREVDRLLKSGRNPDEPSTSGGTALMIAARAGDASAVAKLLDYGAEPNNCGEFDYCPIWYAAAADSLAVMKILVERGADPKWVPYLNGTEYPPLHTAVSNNNLAMVKYLVAAGADIEFSHYWSNYAAETPLAIAVSKGYLDIVKYLLGKGAKIHEVTEVSTGWNTTALDDARKKRYTKVVEYIESSLQSGLYKPVFTVEMFVKMIYQDDAYLIVDEKTKAHRFLERIGTEDLRRIRNAVFARKQYKFKDRKLSDYYKSLFPGYRGDTNEVSVSVTDRKNIEFLKSLEEQVYHRSIAS